MTPVTALLPNAFFCHGCHVCHGKTRFVYPLNLSSPILMGPGPSQPSFLMAFASLFAMTTFCRSAGSFKTISMTFWENILNSFPSFESCCVFACVVSSVASVSSHGSCSLLRSWSMVAAPHSLGSRKAGAPPASTCAASAHSWSLSHFSLSRSMWPHVIGQKRLLPVWLFK